jgi:hypothetical protein
METITNDPIINYQVAIKKIGEQQQPYIMAIENEKAKAKPDLAIIDNNQNKLDELFALRSSLRIEDTEKIQSILNGAEHAI